jgi:hypothetical protein
MTNLEHPMITRINATGYPSKDVEPKESAGSDYYGNKILVGDDIVEHDGEIILVDSLEDYLADVLEFKFRKATGDDV